MLSVSYLPVVGLLPQCCRCVFKSIWLSSSVHLSSSFLSHSHQPRFSFLTFFMLMLHTPPLTASLFLVHPTDHISSTRLHALDTVTHASPPVACRCTNLSYEVQPDLSRCGLQSFDQPKVIDLSQSGQPPPIIIDQGGAGFIG